MKKGNKKNVQKYRGGLVLSPDAIVKNPNSKIESFLVKKKISVYNGCLYQSFTVTEGMIGYKVGFFITTKRLGPRIHAAINKRKQKKTLKK